MGAPVRSVKKFGKDFEDIVGGKLSQANESFVEWMGGGPRPKKPKPPPGPVDDSAALFREMSRQATNRELRRSKGRANAFAGGGYLGSAMGGY